MNKFVVMGKTNPDRGKDVFQPRCNGHSADPIRFASAASLPVVYETRFSRFGLPDKEEISFFLLGMYRFGQISSVGHGRIPP